MVAIGQVITEHNPPRTYSTLTITRLQRFQREIKEFNERRSSRRWVSIFRCKMLRLSWTCPRPK